MVVVVAVACGGIAAGSTSGSARGKGRCTGTGNATVDDINPALPITRNIP